MLCVIYLLRRAGRKLPSDIVKTRPHQGWLYLGQDARKQHPQTTARLCHDETLSGDLVEPLLHAHVKKIERGGILLYGFESTPKYGAQPIPQIWWCVPGPLDDLTAPV